MSQIATPQARQTAHLADTVEDDASGFIFKPEATIGFLGCTKRTLAAYLDKNIWRQIQRNGMRRNFN